MARSGPVGRARTCPPTSRCRRPPEAPAGPRAGPPAPIARRGLELDGDAEIVPGRDGEALSLDGRGQAAIPAAPQLVLNQVFGFSLAFFFKVTRQPGGEWRSLVYKPVGEGDARGLGLWLHPDSTYLRVQLFTVKGPDYVDSRARLPVGEWAHIAFVVDAGGMFLYVNGRLDVAEPLEHPVVTPSGPILLGREPTKPAFHGLLDDFRVYTSALDAEAVRVLAGRG